MFPRPLFPPLLTLLQLWWKTSNQKLCILTGPLSVKHREAPSQRDWTSQIGETLAFQQPDHCNDVCIL
uniref:Secreted protein n=1 Tax=Anguilla anguilla TaxID=7936 RepID=A0A0E9XQY6_ANGAN